jgi:hypothetical protein
MIVGAPETAPVDADAFDPEDTSTYPGYVLVDVSSENPPSMTKDGGEQEIKRTAGNKNKKVIATDLVQGFTANLVDLTPIAFDLMFPGGVHNPSKKTYAVKSGVRPASRAVQFIFTDGEKNGSIHFANIAISAGDNTEFDFENFTELPIVGTAQADKNGLLSTYQFPTLASTISYNTVDEAISDYV